MARVTLNDIAAELGLSKFAVSRALAGKGGVSEETRARVAVAAERMGYAKQAPKPDSFELHLIFHDHDPVNSELAMQIQSGVQYEASAVGVPLRIGWTHDPEQVATLAQAGSGVVLFGPHSPEAIEAVRRTGTPMVRVGWLDPLEPIDQVMAADHEAGAAVGHFLARLGHREIAYVHGTPGFRGRMERLYGLRETAEIEHGMIVHELKFPENAQFAAAFQELRLKTTGVTAFFCAHDGLALTVVSELLRLGYKVPGDATIIGFGDFSAARQITPQLTTVRLPGRDMGIASVRLLLDRIRLRDRSIGAAQRLYIVPTIVERDSSGPPPSGGDRR
ncbi:MAG TPA: LacI family DNA-binding transcriptional regulator [Devosiaceae bacterium]|jgi:LacI family transcriptional regulator|nr:LacI family DNA-binding transcriptional regulator [Devosiaceae bacterium]